MRRACAQLWRGWRAHAGSELAGLGFPWPPTELPSPIPRRGRWLFECYPHPAQVVLFGPTNPFHWHPRSESAIVLLGESGGPVSEFDPKQRPVPMNQISTQSVIDAMESLLSAPAAPAI